MPTQLLYEKTVKNAKANSGGRTVIWDSAISGDASLPGSFGIRVTGNGVKTWIIMFRIEDPKRPGKMKQQYRKIGSYPALSLADARTAARDALMMVGRGVDPIEARENEKREVAAVKTVAEAVEAFIRRHAKQKNRSWKEVERIFKAYVLPKLGERPVPSVTPGDIHELLDALMDAGHPYMANRLFAHTRKFFNWCAERNWIEEPPTKNMSKPAEEEARDRILSDEEVSEVWAATNAMGWPFGPLFQLLLITGQRRNEVGRMMWDQVDFDQAVWTLPKQDTKAKRKHEVPLSPMAIDLLSSLPRNGAFVFTTTGKTPVSGYGRAKVRCDELMSVEWLKSRRKDKWLQEDVEPQRIPHWRLHDLRRTVASGMAEIRIAPHIIEKVLNHSTGQISGVAAVYNRHTYLREKTDALNAWARALATKVQGPHDNVVELRGW
jgi:integrase